MLASPFWQKKLARVAEDLLLHGARVDAVSKWTQMTPLHCAAFYGNAAVIAVLLSKARPSLTAKCPAFEGATPLHLAAMAGSAAAVASLLRGGAPADAKDAHLRTPLDCAKLVVSQQDSDAARDAWAPILNQVGRARRRGLSSACRPGPPLTASLTVWS